MPRPNQAAQARELPELQWRGPFGGIQSELPPTEIESLGFDDSLNMILRLSSAAVRPGYTALANAGEAIVGIADFFKSDGARTQALLTPTRLKIWAGGPQTFSDVLAASPLTGAATDFFTWSVVNYKLLFSQGVDKIQLWDGNTPTFAVASADAPAAKFLIELDYRLLTGNTVEAGTAFPQRLRWCNSFDPTDWTSFGAGSIDLVDSLGPIQGLAKVYGYGYAVRRFGLTRVIPTGIGVNPFQTQGFTSDGKGSICPYSLATFGEERFFYVGEADIYECDGSTVSPIGSRPLDGGRRVGARSRIFADLQLSDITKVTGYVTSSIKGNLYNAYILVIPNRSVWLYSLDEQSWTRFVYDRNATRFSRFAKESIVRIIDLIGTIAQQTWTPASLVASQQDDNALVAFDDFTPGLIDFTNVSESNWLLRSGQLSRSDYRHNATAQRFRVSYLDQGLITFTVRVANEVGQSEAKTVSVGTGSGQVRSVTVPFKLTGRTLQWSIFGAASQKANFVELALLYEPGGEAKDVPGEAIITDA